MLALLSVLSGISGPWRLLAMGALAAALLGGWLYIAHLHARAEQAEQQIARLTQNLETATTAARTNAAAAIQLQAEATRTIEAVTRERDSFAKRSTKIRIIEKEIAHAPATDDGPVAPVLTRTLDRLRESIAETGARDPDHPPTTAKGAAIVQPQPNPAHR